MSGRKRFKHNLSEYTLAPVNMGELIPIMCKETLPGDVFDHSVSALLRASPLVAPVMHPTQVRIHSFFVPTRLIFDGFEDFITGGPDGNDATVPPVLTVPTPASNAPMLDYLGVPQVPGLSVSALPVRAVNLAYNEYYRDQDLAVVRLEDDMTIPRIAWEKDRFSAARPWPQKGDAVTIPLVGEAPVKGIGPSTQGFTIANANIYETDEAAVSVFAGATTATENHIEEDPNNLGFPNVRADLTGVSGLDVDDLRVYLGLQRYKEARARYGSRYTEYLAYLGVNAQDSRLQRPEYLGGGKQTISFSEVLATAESTGVSVGEMKGHGIAALRTNRYRKYFPEHGYVISFMSIRPKAIYENGLERMWSRTEKEDYYTPELELVGQEEVYKKEIFAQNTAADDEVFGWVNRYGDYTTGKSKVVKDFRTSVYDPWHLAREFSVMPGLNQTFIECDPNPRIFADLTAPHFLCMISHSLRARRMVRRNPESRII